MLIDLLKMQAVTSSNTDPYVSLYRTNTVFSARIDYPPLLSLMESLLIDVKVNTGIRGTLVEGFVDIRYTISAFKENMEILSSEQRKQCLSDYAIHNAD